MKSTRNRYSDSPALFDTLTNRKWFRKFNSVGQRETLRECDATLVTYVMERTSAFGSSRAGVEQTALELTLSGGWLEPKSVASVFDAFRPHGHELKEGPGEDEMTLYMWWKVSTVVEELRLEAPEDGVIEARVVRVDEPGVLSMIVREFGSGRPLFVYGSGPWLVSTQGLTEAHIEVLLPDS